MNFVLYLFTRLKIQEWEKKKIDIIMSMECGKTI